MIKYFKNENGHFVCPTCGVIKEKQNSMHYHMKKHLEELNYVCKVCNKGFLQKQTLEQHVRVRHPDKNTTKHACPFDCDFTANSKGNCIIHMIRIHFNEKIKDIMLKDAKTITCTNCITEFNSSGSFYYHCKDCLTFNEEETKKFEL